MRSARSTLVVALLLLTACARADDSIVPGKLNPKVTVKTFSYALYVPPNYDPHHPWPVVFVLDPAARGVHAAQRFIAGAERYGYIIAASNDSRNGPLRIDGIDAMWIDVMSRLNVDKRRVYLAGMSGGARAAITIAAHCQECPAGIIASAAGFPDTPPFDPSKVMFFGIAGDYDFNYPELFRDNEALDRLHATHRFETFDGPHEWPPEDSLAVALAWFRLEEMARGTMPRDQGFIDAQFKTESSRAAQLESENKLYPAYLAYKQLLADFAQLYDVTGVQKQFDALKDRREIVNGTKSERNQFAAQDTFQAPVVALIHSLEEGTPDPEVAIRAVRSTSDLRERSLREKDSNQLIPLRRALAGIAISAFETANATRRRKDFVATRKLFQVALATRPDSPDLLYNIACMYALEGNRKDAIRTLKSSIDHGFKNTDLLKTDPDLEKLRSDPDFREVLEKVANSHGD